jgi:hypothetical protein
MGSRRKKDEKGIDYGNIWEKGKRSKKKGVEIEDDGAARLCEENDNIQGLYKKTIQSWETDNQ